MSTTVRVRLDTETVALLDTIAADRFGGATGAKAKATEWAILTLAEVLSVPDGRLARTWQEALAAYCERRHD